MLILSPLVNDVFFASMKAPPKRKGNSSGTSAP